MSDTTLNSFVASGTTTARLAFTPSPPSPASGPDPGYTWWDTTLQALYVWNAGTSAWVAAGGGGTGTVTHTGTLTANELLVGNGGADIKAVAATDGQIPIGKSADGSVTLATVTAGSGIAVTNGAASITLATSTAQRTRAITFAMNGNGTALTTSYAMELYVPYACTITANTLLADQSGSVQLGISKCAFANFPASLTSIVASAPPTLSAAQSSQDTTLTGWTTAISAGDVLKFTVTSVSTITRLSCVLTVTVS